MWLSRREERNAPPQAQVGEITLDGGMGAYLDGERRGMALFGPGGYHWAPEAGQAVLVVKNGGVGEARCALGAPCESVCPGEVLITSAGGASIRLKNDGGIELIGAVTVNGTPLDDLITTGREGAEWS